MQCDCSTSSSNRKLQALNALQLITFVLPQNKVLHAKVHFDYTTTKLATALFDLNKGVLLLCVTRIFPP